MSVFSYLFDTLVHASAPLLKAAAKWAEQEGLAIVQEVQTDYEQLTPEQRNAYLRDVLSRYFGLSVTDTLTLEMTKLGVSLLLTAVAREIAAARYGMSYRTAILNAGIEQAILLLKAKADDLRIEPAPALSVSS